MTNMTIEQMQARKAELESIEDFLSTDQMSEIWMLNEMIEMAKIEQFFIEDQERFFNENGYI